MHKLAREDGRAPFWASCCLSHIRPSNAWHIHTTNVVKSDQHIPMLKLKIG